MAAVYCSNCGAPLDASGACATCVPESTVPVTSIEATAPHAWQEEPRSATPPPYAGAPPPYAAAPPPFAAAPLTRFSGQWNWGAFFLCPFWLMNHGSLGLGIASLVIGFIPFLGIAALGMAIYFGITGNDWAIRHRAFVDETQFVAVQNAWRNWGFILFAIGFVLGTVGAVMLGLAGILSGVHTH